MNNEHNELVKSILNRTFFAAWKNQKYKEDLYKYGNYDNLEIQLSAVCDLHCDYCYYAKYSKDLYPAPISKPENVLKNLDMLLEWLGENNYYPKFDVFSGEPFATDMGFEVVNKLIDWHIKEDISGEIVIPTNFSFIFSEKKIEKIEELISKGKDNNVRVYLSASVDGKYCDVNRPFHNSEIVRTDEYYDKVFEFAKKYQIAFHPMVYSNNIEKWKDNFLWFQENFKKNDIPWTSLYLLEVRNVEWSKTQIQEFYRFVRFIMNWVCNMCKNIGVPINKLPEFIFKNKVFNLISVFGSMGRGIGCSIQSAMQLRLGDLTTTLCHRNAYDGLHLFKFVSDDNKIIDIEALNYNMMVAMYSAVSRNLPWCETCTIKDFCSGQCLGAMYEVNGDPFIPIPTVCALEHARVAAILDEIDSLGLLQYFYDFTAKKDSIRIYKKYFKGDR